MIRITRGFCIRWWSMIGITSWWKTMFIVIITRLELFVESNSLFVDNNVLHSHSFHFEEEDQQTVLTRWLLFLGKEKQRRDIFVIDHLFFHKPSVIVGVIFSALTDSDSRISAMKYWLIFEAPILVKNLSNTNHM